MKVRTVEEIKREIRMWTRQLDCAELLSDPKHHNTALQQLDALYDELKEERAFVRAFSENKYGELQ